MLWRVDNLFGVAGFNDLAVPHYQHTIANLRDHSQIMRHQHDRQMMLLVKRLQ